MYIKYVEPPFPLERRVVPSVPFPVKERKGDGHLIHVKYIYRINIIGIHRIPIPFRKESGALLPFLVRESREMGISFYIEYKKSISKVYIEYI